jgi:hypothetical protein
MRAIWPFVSAHHSRFPGVSGIKELLCASIGRH